MYSLLAGDLASARSAELREGAARATAPRTGEALESGTRGETAATGATAKPRRLARYWNRGHARYQQSLRRPRWRAG